MIIHTIIEIAFWVISLSLFVYYLLRDLKVRNTLPNSVFSLLITFLCLITYGVYLVLTSGSFEPVTVLASLPLSLQILYIIISLQLVYSILWKLDWEVYLDSLSGYYGSVLPFLIGVFQFVFFFSGTTFSIVPAAFLFFIGFIYIGMEYTRGRNIGNHYALLTSIILVVLYVVTILLESNIRFGSIEYSHVLSVITTNGLGTGVCIWLYYQQILIRNRILTESNRKILFRAWISFHILMFTITIPWIQKFLDANTIIDLLLDNTFSVADIIALLSLLTIISNKLVRKKNAPSS